MFLRYILISFLLFLTTFCLFALKNNQPAKKPVFVKDIPVPENYTRKQYKIGSFSHWVQKLPLKRNNIIIKHDGSPLNNPNYSVLAVIDKACLFKQDLEQCADYCMRFWADYHLENKKLNEFYLFEYSGKKKHFNFPANEYQKFLKVCFTNSNSYSLKTGCKTVTEENLQPGDMFVQNTKGGIGHVSMILDVCENNKGKKLYLVGYSFMPAQEFHIEQANEEFGNNGWFTLDGYYKYLQEKLPYGEPVLRRF